MRNGLERINAAPRRAERSCTASGLERRASMRSIYAASSFDTPKPTRQTSATLVLHGHGMAIDLPGRVDTVPGIDTRVAGTHRWRENSFSSATVTSRGRRRPLRTRTSSSKEILCQRDQPRTAPRAGSISHVRSRQEPSLLRRLSWGSEDAGPNTAATSILKDGTRLPAHAHEARRGARRLDRLHREETSRDRKEDEANGAPLIDRAMAVKELGSWRCERHRRRASGVWQPDCKGIRHTRRARTPDGSVDHPKRRRDVKFYSEVFEGTPHRRPTTRLRYRTLGEARTVSRVMRVGVPAREVPAQWSVLFGRDTARRSPDPSSRESRGPRRIAVRQGATP